MRHLHHNFVVFFVCTFIAFVVYIHTYSHDMRRTYVVRVLQTVKKRSMVMMVMMMDGDDDG